MSDHPQSYSFAKRFWVGSISLFLSAVFLSATLWATNDARRLDAQSVEGLARVVSSRFVAANSARYGDGAYFITYAFQWDRQSIVNERDVPEDFYDSHPVGTSWTIRIHPDAPRIHDLYPRETRTTAAGHLIVSTLSVLFGLWLVLSNGNLTVLRARLAKKS